MEQNKNVISVKRINGSIETAEIVLMVHLDTTDKDYVVYTFNEKDTNDLITIYASLINNENNIVSFNDITSEEWDMIKEYMKNQSKEGEN